MSNAVNSIGHAFSDIGHTIGHALDQIVNGIRDVWLTIYNNIVDALKSIANFIEHNIVILAIIVIIAVIVIAIFAPELLPVIFDAIASFIEAIPAEIGIAAQYFMDVYSFIESSWVAGVMMYVYDGMKYISDINQAALIYQELKDHQYGEAVTRLFEDVLPTISKEVDTKIQSVIDNVTHAFTSVNHDINTVMNAANDLNTGLGQVQTDLTNIGQAFGMKGATDAAEGISQFRTDTLDKIVTQGNQFEAQIQSLMATIINPFVQMDEWYQAIKFNNQEAQNRLKGLVAFSLKDTNLVTGSFTFDHRWSGNRITDVRTKWIDIWQQIINKL